MITKRFIRVRYLILKNLIDFSLILSISFELIKLLVLIILKLIELHLESLVVDRSMMIVQNTAVQIDAGAGFFVLDIYVVYNFLVHGWFREVRDMLIKFVHVWVLDEEQAMVMFN